MLVDVSAEDDRAQRPHQEADAEGHEGEHQLGEFAAAWKEGVPDRRGVVAEDEEIEHLQEIAAGNADDRRNLSRAAGAHRHVPSFLDPASKLARRFVQEKPVEAVSQPKKSFATAKENRVAR